MAPPQRWGILQDAHGRSNLHTLHQASGAGEAKHPHRWTRLQSTKALQKEMESQTPDVALDVVVGGNASGTYAHALLAVE
jgi:hypothetical protein